MQKLAQMNYLNITIIRVRAKELPSKIKNTEIENAFKNRILIQKYEDKKLFYSLVIIKLKKIN